MDLANEIERLKEFMEQLLVENAQQKKLIEQLSAVRNHGTPDRSNDLLLRRKTTG
jgi:hypothetical protein